MLEARADAGPQLSDSQQDAVEGILAGTDSAGELVDQFPHMAARPEDIAGLAFDAPELLEAFSGPRSEIFWLLGIEATAALPDRSHPPATVQRSTAFAEGGFYVLRTDRDRRALGDTGKSREYGRRRTNHQVGATAEPAGPGDHLFKLGRRGAKPVHFPVPCDQRTRRARHGCSSILFVYGWR